MTTQVEDAVACLAEASELLDESRVQLYDALMHLRRSEYRAVHHRILEMVEEFDALNDAIWRMSDKVRDSEPEERAAKKRASKKHVLKAV